MGGHERGGERGDGGEECAPHGPGERGGDAAEGGHGNRGAVGHEQLVEEQGRQQVEVKTLRQDDAARGHLG